MRVKAAGIIAILIVYYSATARADLTIRYDSVQANGKQPLHQVLIKQQRVRIDQPAGDASSVMIDTDSGDIVQLHESSRRFFQINARTISEYASFYQRNKSLVQGLIDHGLARLDPARRDQVEGVINGLDKGSRGMRNIQIRPSGRVAEVLGVECEILGIFNAGKLERELCISSYQQLGLDNDNIQSLEKLKGFVGQFGSAMPKRQQALVTLLSDALDRVNGLPMQLVNYRPDGSVRKIIRAAKISLRPIPEQAYRIPGDFQQQNMPVL